MRLEAFPFLRREDGNGREQELVCLPHVDRPSTPTPGSRPDPHSSPPALTTIDPGLYEPSAHGLLLCPVGAGDLASTQRSDSGTGALQPVAQAQRRSRDRGGAGLLRTIAGVVGIFTSDTVSSLRTRSITQCSTDDRGSCCPRAFLTLPRLFSMR